MVFVNIRTLFFRYRNRIEERIDIDLHMDHPPSVGLHILVGEDDFKLTEVIYDPKTGHYQAYCEFFIGDDDSKEDVEGYVKQFTDEGWKVVVVESEVQ